MVKEKSIKKLVIKKGMDRERIAWNLIYKKRVLKNTCKVGLNQSKRLLTKAIAVGRKWRKDKSYLINKDGGSRRTTPEKLDIG